MTLADGLRRVKTEAMGEAKLCAEGYANDMLLLIANRKFCRYLVASSPLTAIHFLDAVAETKAYRVPIGLFVQNVSTEAIAIRTQGSTTKTKAIILASSDTSSRSAKLYMEIMN